MMNKKIEVKIPNRLLYSIISLLIVVLVVGGIYAYGGNSPTTTGHTLGEISTGFPCDGYLKYSPYSGWTCSTPSSGGVTPPTSACIGSNKGLQWTGSAWSCATYVTSPGSGTCTSVSCSWTNWGTVCAPDYNQYNMHSVPSICSSSSSKYTATSYYCSGGYITNSQLVTCCPNSLPLS